MFWSHVLPLHQECDNPYIGVPNKFPCYIHAATPPHIIYPIKVPPVTVGVPIRVYPYSGVPNGSAFFTISFPFAL